MEEEHKLTGDEIIDLMAVKKMTVGAGLVLLVELTRALLISGLHEGVGFEGVILHGGRVPETEEE